MPRLIAVAIALVVIVAAVLSTKFMSIDEATATTTADKFDPAEYASEHFSADIVPSISEDAVPLSDLLEKLDSGADESDFGNSSGSSSAFSFPVTVTGAAGELNGSILPLTVEGLPEGVAVQVQVGPAINGTAIRDVTGTVDFNEFTNQLEYQNVAIELNNLVKSEVLGSVDTASLEGKQIAVTGAYTRVNPELVSIVPTVIEVGE